MTTHSRPLSWTLTLLFLCACDEGKGAASSPGRRLDETRPAELCAEIDAVSVDDPEYVRGVCTVSAFITEATGGASCALARDRCVDEFESFCTASTGRDDFDCPDTTAGEYLDCMRAIIGRTRERYARVTCDDPSTAISAETLIAEVEKGVALPDGCAAFARSCPDFAAALSMGRVLDPDADSPDASTPLPEPNDPDPILCGGAYRSPCAADKYCAWGDGCGTVGHCYVRERSTCSADPVCGCDGVTYPSECEAALRGVGTAHPGACSAATFTCGTFTCDAATSFCLDVREDRSDADQSQFLCMPRSDCNDCGCVDFKQYCYVGGSCSDVDVLRLACD